MGMIDLGAALAAGMSAQVHAWGDGQVVKLFASSVSDEMIDREFAASRLAAAAGLPVADARERRVIEGRRALVYPRIRGVTLLHRMRREPWRMTALLEQLTAVQHGIHAVSGSSLRTVNEVVAIDIIHGPAPAAVKDAALARLAEMPLGGQLLHGDFHPGNVISREDGLIVIDWAKASTGDPAADLVRTEMIMRFGEGPQDAITNWWRDLAARRIMAAYRTPGGDLGLQLRAWRPLVALAWLRHRPDVRTRAFMRYLERALRAERLPSYE